MQAETNAPDYAAVGEDVVATAYRIAKSDRDVVVAFDLATGKRLPRGGALRALDAHSGKVLYTLD